MSDPENQSLIRSPSQQTAINAGAPQVGGSSSRAFKVAGLTVLACLLIAGQALTAYLVLSQRSDIRSLEEQNNGLKSDMQRGRSAAVPMKIHMPMNMLPMLTSDSTDEEGASTEGPKAEEKATQCQLEAAGVKPVQVPSFRPMCDTQGRYKPQQCWMGRCWCVDTTSGQMIPGDCNAAVSSRRLSRVMALPDTVQLSEE
ncbi:uncharacterized protein ACJ7VT_015408 [Polymixia lowei]